MGEFWWVPLGFGVILDLNDGFPPNLENISFSYRVCTTLRSMVWFIGTWLPEMCYSSHPARFRWRILGWLTCFPLTINSYCTVRPR